MVVGWGGGVFLRRKVKVGILRVDGGDFHFAEKKNNIIIIPVTPMYSVTVAELISQKKGNCIMVIYIGCQGKF